MQASIIAFQENVALTTFEWLGSFTHEMFYLF